MKVFVFELICAGGMGANAPPTLRREGWAMLSALVEDFDRVDSIETVTLLDHACPGPLGRVCRRSTPSAERGRFQELAALADLTLVIAPESEQLLATWSRLALDAGTALLGSDLAAIGLTADKLALARHLLAHGIRTPSTTLLDDSVGDGRASRHFPAICKPRHGAGSQATFLVNDEQELPHWARARREACADDFLVQPYVPGLPASVSFLIGPSQKLALQ